MAQHDYVLDNGPGLAVRTDMNAAILAIVTQNSGPVEPTVMYPGMLWLDTATAANGILKQRNQANNAWLPVQTEREAGFLAADISFFTRTGPNRFVWNDKYDGSGTDVMSLDDAGILQVKGKPVVTPVGALIAWPGATVPSGFLECDGSSLSTTTYADLYAVLGTTYGSGTGTFKLPDLRGEFIRGWSHGRSGVDASRVHGSWQDEDFIAHNHTASASSIGNHNHGSAGMTTYVSGNPFADAAGMTLRDDSSATKYTTSNGGHTHTITVNNRGGLETRPRNVAMMWVVKY